MARSYMRLGEVGDGPRPSSAQIGVRIGEVPDAPRPGNNQYPYNMNTDLAPPYASPQPPAKVWFGLKSVL